MEDHEIVALFWARSEEAIRQASSKYGRYCRYIAEGILHSREDSEECVNDALLQAWRTIPPHRPERLAVFLGKITRNLSLNRWERERAQKRGGGEVSLALEELQDCLPAPNSGQLVEDLALSEACNRFLAALPAEARKIFLRRYWYFSPVKEIAADYGLSESKVKMSLLRSRKKLKRWLEKEGIDL